MKDQISIIKLANEIFGDSKPLEGKELEVLKETARKSLSNEPKKFPRKKTIMNPKEKAEDLVNNILETLYDDGSLSFKTILYSKSKKIALIAVDEIIEFMRMDDEYTETTSNANSKWVGYWQEVKQEIEKL